jgi:peptide chain release factor 3
MHLNEEIKRRKTFAIISHPDAGKTTLTEKFLLFGGAIQVAGAVKSNKIKKTATSDFMEIEKQRGISVATSVMAFPYRNYNVNLLDTPGHKDFAEDTYRTLTAVDSVILVIDCVKGVEEQTERLMEVCRMRDTPVIIFINKMDRPGRDAFELLDELEEKLNIKVRPLSWPINYGKDFKGVYKLYDNSLNLFDAAVKQKVAEHIEQLDGLNDPRLDQLVGQTDANTLREQVELVEGVYDAFSPEAYHAGQLAPVFFGSALNNFGVKELLDTFCEIAPLPRGRQSDTRFVAPTEPAFSGFVFKIHANIDPRHRDRIAFVRVVSGHFERNTFYTHVRLGKTFKFANPATFMAQDKSTVEEAWPGDVVGLYDTGNFKIGDTLTEGEKFMFQGIPSFSPELFKEVINKDPMKTKQLEKGLMQLTEEGLAQLFVRPYGSARIIGTVGQLQFEVIQYRLLNEYGASVDFKTLPYHLACWMTSDNRAQLEDFIRVKTQDIALDKEGQPVYMAPSAFMLNNAGQQYPHIVFHKTTEFRRNALKDGVGK